MWVKGGKRLHHLQDLHHLEDRRAAQTVVAGERGACSLPEGGGGSVAWPDSKDLFHHDLFLVIDHADMWLVPRMRPYVIR